MDASAAEILSFLAVPFLTCLVLAGIHCYLGFHVLMRGVIFVDLSLAQTAAFGSTLAFFLGLDHSGVGAYSMALAWSLAAAGLFAFARRFEEQLPQEALIGITYALGSAAVILCIDKMAHGTEHVKSLLVGQVLWVGQDELIRMTLIYSAVGLIHYVFRHQFFAASRGELTKNQGLWDFMFYALFGVVITCSVKVAGILQVFSYLVVPSVVANIFFQTFRTKLLFGWGLGFVLSLLGMLWSYQMDLPSGAAIVVCFASVPVLLVFALPWLKRGSV